MAPIFTLNLNQKVIPGKLTLGLYDGIHPCLTAATTGEKIFIHNPHEHLDSKGGRMVLSSMAADIAVLNINQPINTLCSGRLSPKLNGDVLLIGTPTHLLAYDVCNNADLFYNEISDGSNALVIGKLGSIDRTLAIVGGNCALQGFDYEGNDPFWTVTGDNIRSLALMDFNQNGQNELLVGSEDYEIRVFREDEIECEISETEAVTGLKHMHQQIFSYSLANGTVGVYERTHRWWRIKSKNQAVSMFSFDVDGDGVPELITGWSNGKVDARNDRSGEVIFKDNLNQSVAGITQGDYRQDGKDCLIVCSIDGEVRGYHPLSGMEQTVDGNLEQQTIHELAQKKKALLLELRNYEENTRIDTLVRTTGNLAVENVGIIPANTQLQTGLAINMGSSDKLPHVEIALATSNETIIKSVLIFAEGIFAGESHVVHPPPDLLSNTVRVPLYPPKDVAYDLHIKAMVGGRTSEHFHVFELTRQLPRFSMYALADSTSVETPKGKVKFLLKERVQRVVLWINQNFLLMDDMEVSPSLDIAFISLRTSAPLRLTMKANGETTIYCDDMDLTGEIIQALTTFLNVENLQAEADFPDEIEMLEATMKKVTEYQVVRERLSAEMADYSGVIRSLVVRAEDARIMCDMRNMKRWYMELYDVNKDLINDYKIRCNNHEQLLTCLKTINQSIQRAGRLRVGKPKATVVNCCREAFKASNIPSLVKSIRLGHA